MQRLTALLMHKTFGMKEESIVGSSQTHIGYKSGKLIDASDLMGFTHGFPTKIVKRTFSTFAFHKEQQQQILASRSRKELFDFLPLDFSNILYLCSKSLMVFFQNARPLICAIDFSVSQLNLALSFPKLHPGGEGVGGGVFILRLLICHGDNKQ